MNKRRADGTSQNRSAKSKWMFTFCALCLLISGCRKNPGYGSLERVPPETSFYVLVGGWSRNKQRAVDLAHKVTGAGFDDVAVRRRASADGWGYTVRVGELESGREAQALKKKLAAAGFKALEARP